MVSRRRVAASEDAGAVLIYVAVVLVGLMAFTTFVVDFGMVHVARGQAQNSADAAAYAAAIALASDDDRTEGGAATQAALAIARLNRVWGEEPSIVAADVTFPPCHDGTNACVRVAVHRTAARGNALPTVFGRLLGLVTQDVRAVATAEVRPANISKCLKPWAVPDRWQEVGGDPLKFDKYDGSGAPLPSPDLYTPPSASSTGTGYRIDRDFATPLTMRQGCTAISTCQPAQLGYFLPINLAPGCTGGGYLNAIINCATTCGGDPVTVRINQDLMYLPSGPAGLGTQTVTGVNALIALDPNATFNPVTKKVENSCVGGGGVPYTCSVPGLVESPRIVAVPAYDVNWFEDHRRPGGGATVNNLIRVSNILSVFIGGLSGSDIATHLVTKTGPWDPTTPVVTGGSTFTRTILIVR
jgi:Flp pilus assembly protein TadG